MADETVAREFDDLRWRYRPRVMGHDDAERAYALGWPQAQGDYLARERERARQAMTELIARRGLEAPVAIDEAYELLELAFDTFTSGPGGEPGATRRAEAGGLFVSVVGCPTQDEPRAQSMCSERVCPFWHRRQGWIEAMGLSATDMRDADARGLPGGCTSVVVLQAD
jgi:hypothetical protein